MAVKSGILGLLIPGVLEPPAQGGEGALADARALMRLLHPARCQALPARGYEATLFHLLGAHVDAGQDVPAGAVGRLGEGEGRADGWWMRADPVHLHPDMGRLVLVDAGLLDLAPDEAGALVAELNERVFHADGMHLTAPTPMRWYLRLPGDPGIRTRPLDQVLGRCVDTLLPSGPRAREWHTRLTEAQMVLAASAVNEAREAYGRPSVNSLWPWGAGILPTVSGGGWTRIHAGADPLARGLARRAGIDLVSPPPNPMAEPEAGEASLWALDTVRAAAVYGDAEAWRSGIATLEAEWFAPLLATLRRHRRPVTLYPADGRGCGLAPPRWWEPRRGASKELFKT